MQTGLGSIGGHNAGNLFSNLVQPQQAPVNPYQMFNAFHHPAPAQPMGSMMGGGNSPMRVQPQQQAPNPFGALMAPQQPAPSPFGMGGMGGFMGGMVNPMAQYGMSNPYGAYGGGYRMW